MQSLHRTIRILLVSCFIPLPALACGGQPTPISLHLGEGKPGEEEIRITVNPDEPAKRKAFKIYDVDGAASIFLMTSLIKEADKDYLSRLRPRFEAYLRKLIGHTLSQMEEQNNRIKDPNTSQEDKKDATERLVHFRQTLEESQALLRDLDGKNPKAELQRRHFGVFVKRILGHLEAAEGAKYQFSEFKSGAYEPKSADLSNLEDILPSGVFTSINTVGVDGEFIRFTSACGGLSPELENDRRDQKGTVTRPGAPR